MGNISKNFSIEEFFVSADHPEIAKTDALVHSKEEGIILRLELLAANCLQPLRDHVGTSAKILSGYRSPELNMAVGGERDSDHMRALASDITFPGREEDLYNIYKWGVKNLCYRQIIFYPSQKFIHLSINWLDTDYKHNALVKVGKDYIPLEEFAS